MLDQLIRRVQLAQKGWRSIHVDEDGVMEVPEDRGFLLRLDSSTGEAIIETVGDHHEPSIHPNCYIPEFFTKLQTLKGGGSGAAVFAGSHPLLKQVVMKHAGAKDTREVLSLAEIGKELQRRDPRAAEYLRNRIPEFSFFYISPRHVRDRSGEICSTTHHHESLRKIVLQHQGSSTNYFEDETDVLEPECENEFPIAIATATTLQGTPIAPTTVPRQIRRRLLVHRGQPIGIETLLSRVLVHIPSFSNSGKIKNGYNFLGQFVDHLETSQRENNWKITVGQRSIGGPDSENGAHVLTAGRLVGPLLKKTIQEYTAILQNLRALTLVEEKDVLQQVRNEVHVLDQTNDVTKISKTSDQFVGTCITKNFHPKNGRFVLLRQFGQKARDGSLVLTESETQPAHFLGRLLQKGTLLSSIFAHSEQYVGALDLVEDSWLDTIQIATSFDDPAMTDRIWTCGLTDAGLHNVFVDVKKGLSLFDLGKPQYMPEPAFLTKFLMSFFHAFGMEDNQRQGWVHRFETVTQEGCPPLLKLTQDTERKIIFAQDSYKSAVDSFVRDLFHNNKQATALMVRYTVLQLVSDAGFCLQRWHSKGGGRQRFGYNARKDLSKWLWRSLWDLYIASKVCHRFSGATDHCSVPN